MEDVIISGLALILTFVAGLFKEKPGYKKPKNLIKAINKAAEDDVFTAAEIKEIRDVFK